MQVQIVGLISKHVDRGKTGTILLNYTKLMFGYELDLPCIHKATVTPCPNEIWAATFKDKAGDQHELLGTRITFSGKQSQAEELERRLRELIDEVNASADP